MIDAFLPSNNATVVIAVGAAASITRLPSGTASTTFPARSGGDTLRITNMAALLGANIFVETSPSGIAVATTTTSVVVRPQTDVFIRRAPGDDSISTIADAAGPTNLIVSVGNGGI
jgi:hypothetical protein